MVRGTVGLSYDKYGKIKVIEWIQKHVEIEEVTVYSPKDYEAACIKEFDDIVGNYENLVYASNASNCDVERIIL